MTLGVSATRNPREAAQRDEELHLLALHLVPGLGPKKTSYLMEQAGSARNVFRYSVSELEAMGVPQSLAQSILSGCTFDDAASQHKRVIAEGVAILSILDNVYPKQLRHLYDPPPILFLRGRIELLETVMIGVVGTRRPTTYGVAASDKLSREFALAGLTVVSGMAKGVDTAAHKGALEVAGNTVAVFGCGVDQIYPAENRKLADQISKNGLIVSEFPMGTPAFPQNFPIRNRVVSGLSFGIVVVEGAQYSGSAITARLSLEQGRSLFAVPGNITSKMSWVPNLLIKQGAKLVQGAEDVLVELSPEERRRVAVHRKGDSAEPAQPSLDQGFRGDVHRAILSRLAVDEAMHIDILFGHLPQYSSSDLIAALFELEVGGAIRQLAGQNFIKTW